jgi:peptide-methionine (R)-S-oxide reductase
MKQILVLTFVLSLMINYSKGQNADSLKFDKMNAFKVNKSNAEWEKELSAEQYKVMRQCGTELPGSGKYDNFYESGVYECAACGQVLFDSKTKFHSGSGWPSFYDIISAGHVTLIEDKNFGMVRTEVRCSKCGSHLGHVFNDGPAPTHLRYCINSVALKFVRKEE